MAANVNIYVAGAHSLPAMLLLVRLLIAGDMQQN